MAAGFRLILVEGRSPVIYRAQWVILEARGALVHFLFPGGPVCGRCFPGVGVQVHRFEVALAGVRVPQLRASGRSLPRQQLTVQQALGDASVLYAADVARPSPASV